jgi:hypothetical protein
MLVDLAEPAAFHNKPLTPKSACAHASDRNGLTCRQLPRSPRDCLVMRSGQQLGILLTPGELQAIWCAAAAPSVSSALSTPGKWTAGLRELHSLRWGAESTCMHSQTLTGVAVGCMQRTVLLAGPQSGASRQRDPGSLLTVRPRTSGVLSWIEPNAHAMVGVSFPVGC